MTQHNNIAPENFKKAHTK